MLKTLILASFVIFKTFPSPYIKSPLMLHVCKKSKILQILLQALRTILVIQLRHSHIFSKCHTNNILVLTFAKSLISQRDSKDEHISDNTKLLELLLLKYILLFPGHRFSHSFLMIFILRTKHKFNKLNNAECILVSSLSLLRKQQYCFLLVLI